MKTLTLLVMLLYGISVRAEQGVEYTPPEDRPGLWTLIPTDEDVPYWFPGVQYELVKFRGCEFWPELWGQNFHMEKKVRYGPIWTVRGWEGLQICFPELVSLGPADNFSLPINNSIGIGFSLRWSIGQFHK